jgi:alanine racemase
MTHLVWAEIDLSAVAHNVRELRRLTSPDARLMAVVKANAYGHGAVETALKALESGADALGVARLDEGIRLRKAGIHAPVLIFGYTPVSRSVELFEYDLTQTVYSFDTARAMSDIALRYGITIRIHIKTDTGMGRLGIAVSESHFKAAIAEVEAIARLGGLESEGIFTHFASADSADISSAKHQFERFTDFLDALRLAGIDIPVRHAANSAAITALPESHLDMVRAGISLYGLYPSDETDRTKISLMPVMSLKARVVHLKKVPAGFSVSYGMTYKTDKPTIIATVPVGYADGLNRGLSSRGQMLVRGQRAHIAGRVCMDMTMLDVGHIPDVSLDDEVVIFGTQGQASLTADEVASNLGTINYEVVSAISDRVPRVFPGHVGDMPLLRTRT